MMDDVQRDGSPQQQPEYGQFKQPEYGAMAGQYPGYDPYLYGKSEGEETNATSAQQPIWNAPNAQPAVNGQSGLNGQVPMPNGQPVNDQPANGQPNNPYPNGPWQQQGQLQPINLDDPNQNPLYGRWDPYAIVAFVCSVAFSLPLLPALIGGLAIWRTKTFHMKGRGLAIAAVIINILTTILQIWMWVNGISVFDLYSQLYSSMYGGGSGSSGNSGTFSA